MLTLSQYLGSVGRRNYQIFTNSDTFYKQSNLDFVDLILVGAGGPGNAYADYLIGAGDGGGGGAAGATVFVKDYYVGDIADAAVIVGVSGKGVPVDTIGTFSGELGVGDPGGASSFDWNISSNRGVRAIGGMPGGLSRKFSGGASGPLVCKLLYMYQNDLIYYGGAATSPSGQRGRYKVVPTCEFPFQADYGTYGGWAIQEYYATGGHGWSGELSDVDPTFWDHTLAAIPGAPGTHALGGINTTYTGGGAGGFFGAGGSGSIGGSGTPDADSINRNSGAGGGGMLSATLSGGWGSNGLVIVLWN